MGADNPHPWIGYAITAIVVAVVMAIRLKRAGVARPLKVNRLWIIPALYGAVTIAVFAATPPHDLGWIICAVALAGGAAAGWQRGRMIRIEVDPETRSLTAQSPFAVLFILVLILARQGLRLVLTGSGIMTVATITDALITFALGLLSVQRLEMYLRARRLLGSSGGA